MSLRLRLALCSALISVVVLGTAGWTFAHLVHGDVDAALSAGLQQRSALLAAAIRTSSGPIVLPQPQRAGILPPAESLIQVFSAHGTVLAEVPAGARPLLSPPQLAAASRHPVEFTAAVGPGGDPTKVLAVPVTRPGGQRVIAVVGASVGVTAHAVRSVQLAVAAVMGPGVLLTGLSAWLLAGAALRPVEQMRRRAAQISAADMGARLPVPGSGDEVAALARTLNELLGRLQGAVDQQRQLVADAGHELRTPLTVLRGELELALRHGQSCSELRTAVVAASREAERVVRLAEDLLLLARADQDSAMLLPRATDLPDLLRSVADMAQQQAASKPVSIMLRTEPMPPVVVDPDRVHQIVGNLLDNAVRFAPPMSTVDVHAYIEYASGGRVWIEVADSGPGFPPAFLPEAFERFRRADDARSRSEGGAGLGLSIVRSLARAHGGDATATNRPDGGAVVRVWLKG